MKDGIFHLETEQDNLELEYPQQDAEHRLYNTTKINPENEKKFSNYFDPIDDEISKRIARLTLEKPIPPTVKTFQAQGTMSYIKSWFDPSIESENQAARRSIQESNDREQKAYEESLKEYHETLEELELSLKTQHLAAYNSKEMDIPIWDNVSTFKTVQEAVSERNAPIDIEKKYKKFSQTITDSFNAHLRREKEIFRKKINTPRDPDIVAAEMLAEKERKLIETKTSADQESAVQEVQTGIESKRRIFF